MKARSIGCTALAAIAVLLAAGIAVAASHGGTAPAATGPVTSPVTVQTAQAATSTAPAAPAPPASTAPAGTVAQLAALTAAENYLGDGQGFSRQGLIDQLDSPYGNQFQVTDATWAADHAGADWNAQAVECAKNYMSDGQGFSRQGLIDQLDSPYGSKFTLAQAHYAASAVGLR